MPGSAAGGRARSARLFKLTHRDLGPSWRCLGSAVPSETPSWQDALPAVNHPLVDAQDVAQLKSNIRGSGLTMSQLVRTAWEPAASFRGTDMCGGADGSRLSPAVALVDSANLLRLTVPEMSAGRWPARAERERGPGGAGVFTSRPGTLSNDFFVNVLDISMQWTKSASGEGLDEGRDRETGKVRWTATPVDLALGSNAELRAIAEVYAANDGREETAKDFGAAWTKMMEADRG